MRFKPMHVVSTTLFLTSLAVSFVGTFTSGAVRSFANVWGWLLVIVGWIFHIIGLVK